MAIDKSMDESRKRVDEGITRCVERLKNLEYAATLLRSEGIPVSNALQSEIDKASGALNALRSI